ncbi:MAG TPA: hypothetical protein VEY71_04730 [Chitinophagales bacterium]|nr:hypothetical protein [Chitinophagales bacterium]
MWVSQENIEKVRGELDVMQSTEQFRKWETDMHLGECAYMLSNATLKRIRHATYQRLLDKEHNERSINSLTQQTFHNATQKSDTLAK